MNVLGSARPVVAVRLVLLLTVLLWWVTALLSVMTGTVRVVSSPLEFIVETVDGPVEKRLMLALCSMMCFHYRCISKINGCAFF